nr:ribonuclease H-like domain-containing protein [Tanacetum cinerariifolium]
MHKAFPLPVIEFPLLEEVPTASEESFYCQKKRDATAKKIALLLKSSSNCQSKSYDSYAKLQGMELVKKGRIVTLTTDDMQKRKNDVKARTTLLLALPNEHQLRFSKHKTAQELWAAILKTFGGNEATKKTKKNILKQQYGNFKAEGSETLEQTFNRLQAPKVLMAIDGVGWDWSYMVNDEENHALVADEKAPTEFSLMAKTSTESLTKDLELLKKEKGELETKLTGFQTASKDLNSLLESQRLDKNNEGLGYSAIPPPPPPAQVYSPFKNDFSWTGLLEFADDTVTDYSRPSPAIESTSDDAQNRNPSVTETKASPNTISPKPFIKFVKATDRSIKTKTAKVKTAKPAVKYAAMYSKPSKSSNVRGKQRNWNNLKSHQLGTNFVIKKKECFNCGDFNHLTYDCGVVVKKGRTSPTNSHKTISPRTVIHKPYRPPMRAIRPNMNVAQPNRTSFYKPAHSYTKRHFQRTSAVRSQYRGPRVATVNRKFPTINRKLPTVNRKLPTSNTKFSTADLGNVSYLSDYEPFDGGYVSSGHEGCTITCKGRDFKLLDDANMLLRTPRKHNMYCIDLNNIVSHKDLTCLVAKASADECMLWHRRLGHLNFTTMNRLVRHNLVRGLPSKCFENDHTFTTFPKGKQHKASCLHGLSFSKLRMRLVAYLGLQKKDYIFLPQDKYVGDILKKFGYSNVRSVNSPMDKENP